MVQFDTATHTCRRCHASLDPAPAPGPCAVPVPAPTTFANPSKQLAVTVKTLRLRAGLSQRQLASRIPVPRTYISKIENSNALPTLPSLERLALALEVTVPDLLRGGERSRQDEIGELMKDGFIAELLPFVSRLNRMQMSSILTQVHHITLRRASPGVTPAVDRAKPSPADFAVFRLMESGRSGLQFAGSGLGSVRR